MAADLTGGAVLLSRTRERRDFAVPSQPEVKIGYDRSNDVAIPYEGVSRRHALITFDGKEYWIEDVGSANGTYLNAARLVQRERLKHLDVVTLGRRADLIFVRRSGDVPRKAKLGITAARLEILDGLDAGTKRELPRGSVTIGRSPGNNIVADSQLVSKVHARIERTGVELVLTDLQSANGTLVNGEKIDSRALKDGDEISVGRARSYRVRIEQGEVLTGDVAVSPDKPGVVSLSSLPMDWRTHLEWSPAEAAEFDRARAKLRPSAPPAEKPPAEKPAPAKAPAAKPPVAKPAPAKAEEPKHAKPEKPEKSEAAGPARAAEPVPVEKAPPEKKPAAAAAKAALDEPPAHAEKPGTTPALPAETPKPATPPVAKAAASPLPEEPKPAIPIPVPVPVVEKAAPAPAPAPVAPPPIVHPAPVPAPPPARDATATRALTPDQLPRVFLETPTRTFPLGLGTFAIGRDPASDVRLDGSEISRHHARLQVTDQAATLEDLKTVNGTYINRQKLAAPRALADGDEVTFGSLRFKIRFGAGYPKA